MYVMLEMKSCTNSHVWLAPCINCLCHRVNKVATDAKVTYLHFSTAVDQNIWRFHIAMYHFELSLKVVQCLYNLHTMYSTQKRIQSVQSTIINTITLSSLKSFNWNQISEHYFALQGCLSITQRIGGAGNPVQKNSSTFSLVHELPLPSTCRQ